MIEIHNSFIILVETNIMILQSISNLKATPGTLTDIYAKVLSYYTIGDNVEGDFYWDASSTEADNGGTIFEVSGSPAGRWKRIYQESVNVKWFGAKGDGIADDTSKLQKAIDFCSETKVKLQFPTGLYLITSTIYVDKDLTYIEGLVNPFDNAREATISDCATIKYTGTGLAMQVCKSRASNPKELPTKPQWLSNIQIGNLRIEVAQNSACGLWVFHSMHSKFDNIAMWGSYGAGTQLLRVSSGVDNLYERIFLNGAGRTGPDIPTDLSHATEACASLELGYANEQMTTTVFRRCYFHYGFKGISGYYTFEMTDSVIEGNYIGYDCNGFNESKFTNCWFEANYYRDANFHIGSYEFINCWFNNGKSSKVVHFGTGIGINTLSFTNCIFKADPDAPFIFGNNPSGSNIFNPGLTRSGKITFISSKFQPNTKLGYIYNFYNSTGDFYNYIKILNANNLHCLFSCTYTEGSATVYSAPNGLDGKYIINDKGYISELNLTFANALTTCKRTLSSAVMN